jgi:nicotinate-nucleotide--dimethylbenzimidazole phosphoribosyltransferase
MPGDLLEATIAAIIGPDETAGLAARERQARLTKPEGALGQLEEVSIRLARITGQLRPALTPRSLVICAADHGVTAEGVSAYPPVVTQQMVLNFLNGGAAASVLCRQFDVNLVVLDAGVAGDLPEDDRLISAKIRRGTANFAQEPAMSRAEAVQAIESGIEAAYG